MEFDKSRIYTAVNANELHEGDLVYAADSLGLLKSRVKNDIKDFGGTITSIGQEHEVYRFNLGVDSYALAYLVERAPEKKWRPFKDINELEDTWMEKTGMIKMINNTMPSIWLRKKDINGICCITSFYISGNAVFICGRCNTMEDLLSDYEFLDGTPCGVKE